MKNILVDAIRQLQDDGSPAESLPAIGTEESADTSPIAEGGEKSSEMHDLQLLESTGRFAVDAAENDNDVFEYARITDDSDEHEGLALDTSANEKEFVSFTGKIVTSTSGTGARGSASIIVLGKFSPLICLVLALVTAAAYSLFQSTAGRYIENETFPLAERDLATGGPDEKDLTQFGGVPNRFQLTRAAQSVAERPMPVQASTAVNRIPLSAPAAIADKDTGTSNPDARIPSTRPGTVAATNHAAYLAVTEAYLAYQNRDYEAAELGYRKALQLSPLHPNALEGLAAILAETDRAHEALQYYEMLLSVDPDSIVAIAALLADSSTIDAADKAGEIKYLIQKFRNSARLQFELGSLHASQQQWPDARIAFERAKSLDPENANYLFNLAVTFDHLGRSYEAQEYYTSSLELAQDNTAINRSLVLARLQELSQITGSSL